MTEIHYMISDVSRILDIPANVLRYLEYHLSLNIKRTELGHRYYLQEDIDLLRAVKVLRDKGFHLKIIKSILPYINQVRDLEEDKLNDLRDRLEAALGLSGIEAQERVKAQYGKAADIDMEEGDFIIKDPATKQRTRLSSVKMTTSNLRTQPITKEADQLQEKDKSGDLDQLKGANQLKEVDKIKEVDRSKEVDKIKEVDQSKEADQLKKVDQSKQVCDPIEVKLQQTTILQKDMEANAQLNLESKLNQLKEADKPKEAKELKEKEKIKEVNKYKKIDKMKEKGKPQKSDMIQETDKPKSVINSNVSERDIGNLKDVDNLRKLHKQKEASYKEEVAAAKIEVVKNKNKTPRIIGVAKKGYIERNQVIQDNEKMKAVDLVQESEKSHSLEQPAIQEKQMLERKADTSLLRVSQDKIVQFREIMCSIVMDALSQNNQTLTNDINEVVTQSVVKEMDYMMRIREERQEERFRQLDRTIRETQLQRQQAAATKEGKKKKQSKFFRKHKVRI